MGTRAVASGRVIIGGGFLAKEKASPPQSNSICSLLYYCHSSGGFANESWQHLLLWTNTNEKGPCVLVRLMQRCLQDRNWAGYISGSSFQSDLYKKKKKIKKLWAALVGAGRCAAYSLGCIPACSRRPVWQENGLQKVCMWRWKNRRGEAGSIFPLGFLSCIAFLSGVCLCFLDSSITRFNFPPPFCS